ncbi:MAG: Hsp70 family protein [Micrococcales bacterium]|nr:Hsp70 family protein [Micrococcales bacterium]
MDLIVDFLLARVKRRHRVDLSANQTVRGRLRDAAEQAQHELLSAAVAHVRVPFLELGGDGPINLDTTLTQAELEQITGKPPGPRDAVEPDKPDPSRKTMRTAETSAPARAHRGPHTRQRQAKRRRNNPPGRRQPAAGPAASALVRKSRGARTSVSWSRVVAVLVVLLVCGVGARIWWNSEQGSADVGGCVTAVDCMPQVVADLVEAVGGTQFLEIQLGRDGHAVAEAPNGPATDRVERLTWRAGEISHGLASQPTPEALRDMLFDVTAVDWVSIEHLAAQMPELGGTDVDRISVDVSRSRYGDVGVSLTHFRLHVVADPAGRIVWMSGGDRGSPAATWEVAGFYDLVPAVVDDFVVAAASTQFVELRFLSCYANATAQSGARTGAELSWDHGVVTPSSTGLSIEPDALFDITGVDWTVAGQLAAQMATLTLAPSELEHARGIEYLTLTVHRPTSDQERRATTEVVFVFTAKSRGSATTVVADATGEIVWMHGGARGSPAATWAADHP